MRLRIRLFGRTVASVTYDGDRPTVTGPSKPMEAGSGHNFERVYTDFDGETVGFGFREKENHCV